MRRSIYTVKKVFAAEGSTPNLDMKVSPEFTRPSLSRRSMYCRDFDLCQSRSASLRSSGRNARLWDNPLPEAGILAKIEPQNKEDIAEA